MGVLREPLEKENRRQEGEQTNERMDANAGQSVAIAIHLIVIDTDDMDKFSFADQQHNLMQLVDNDRDEMEIGRSGNGR
jgi:hypothetical protein